MKGRLVVAILSISIISGCAVEHYRWKYKDGTADQQAFSGAELECKAVAKRLGSGLADGADPLWISCMKSKGWVTVETLHTTRPWF